MSAFLPLSPMLSADSAPVRPHLTSGVGKVRNQAGGAFPKPIRDTMKIVFSRRKPSLFAEVDKLSKECDAITPRRSAMNKDDHQAVSARDLMAVTVFYAINILLFPVTLIGYVIWVGKATLTGRGSGVSRTAQGPLSIRWFMHKLGTRQGT